MLVFGLIEGQIVKFEPVGLLNFETLPDSGTVKRSVLQGTDELVTYKKTDQ